MEGGTWEGWEKDFDYIHSPYQIRTGPNNTKNCCAASTPKDLIIIFYYPYTFEHITTPPSITYVMEGGTPGLCLGAYTTHYFRLK